jgi:hypothetical protein
VPSKTDRAPASQRAGSGRAGAARQARDGAGGGAEVVDVDEVVLAAHRRGGAAVDDAGAILFVAHGADIGTHRGSVDAHGKLLQEQAGERTNKTVC